MTDEVIEAMARGIHDANPGVHEPWTNIVAAEALGNRLAERTAALRRTQALAAVAPLIAAAERERCAQVAHQHGYDLTNLDERNGAFSAAAAIRALP